MDIYPSDNVINMCYYNFYLEAKENLILANFDYKRGFKQFTLQEKGWSHFFRGTESLIRKINRRKIPFLANS